MFRLSAPSDDEIRRFISGQKDSDFSCPEVGASATAASTGYNVDHNRIQLGKGEDTWQRAANAIRVWKMFSMPWVSLHWPSAPLQIGTDVAVSVHHFGFFSLNACRIVYVVDEESPLKRFGFAYGTLAEHAESGEERFTIEWNRDDDKVWYDILAFSPAELLAGCHEKPAALAWRAATRIESRATQADLSPNWAALWAGGRAARCSEAYGAALQCKPANYTKGLARASQVEFPFLEGKKLNGSCQSRISAEWHLKRTFVLISPNGMNGGDWRGQKAR